MSRLKIIPVLLPVLFVISLPAVYALNYKMIAYKRLDTSGQYSIKPTATSSAIKTDSPSASNFELNLELITYQRYAFSLGWTESTSTYSLKYQDVDYSPTDKKTILIFGFKSYINQQLRDKFRFNYYVGVDYIRMMNTLKLQADNLNVNKSYTAVGTGVNLGVETLFDYAGVRLEASQKEIAGSAEAGEVGISYSLNKLVYGLGVFLFF